MDECVDLIKVKLIDLTGDVGHRSRKTSLVKILSHCHGSGRRAFPVHHEAGLQSDPDATELFGGHSTVTQAIKFRIDAVKRLLHPFGSGAHSDRAQGSETVAQVSGVDVVTESLPFTDRLEQST